MYSNRHESASLFSNLWPTTKARHSSPHLWPPRSPFSLFGKLVSVTYNHPYFRFSEFSFVVEITTTQCRTHFRQYLCRYNCEPQSHFHLRNFTSRSTTGVWKREHQPEPSASINGVNNDRVQPVSGAFRQTREREGGGPTWKRESGGQLTRKQESGPDSETRPGQTLTQTEVRAHTQ